MRRRVLWSTVAVVSLAVVLLAVPLAVAARGLLVARALDTLQAQTEQAAVIVDQRVRTLGEARLTLELLARELGARFTLYQGDDLALVDTAGPPVPPVDAPTATALQGQVGRGRAGGALVAAAPVTSSAGRTGLVLRASRPDDALGSSIVKTWLLIGLGSAGILALTVVAAAVQGQRLAAPLEELARSAARLGDGDFTARAPRSDLPEVDAIADALDRTADRLSGALERGTAFAADASHQLRTPLTALRLHLEGLEQAGSPGAAAALAEADRLEATIDQLVALTRPEAVGAAVVVADVVAEHVPAWRAQLATLGRQLRVEVDPAARARARPAALAQATQVLIDNAVRHGDGEVTLAVDRGSWPEPLPGSGQHARGVRVCVRDEGPGIVGPVPALDPAGADRGGDRSGPDAGGRGLRLARALVEAEGGRLLVDARDGRRFVCLLVPGAPA